MEVDCRVKCLILLGERGGARTHDPVIKSHVLYRLSYALPWPRDGFARLPSSSVIWKSMSCRHVSCRHVELASRGNRPFPDHAFGPRCVGGRGAEVNSGSVCHNS